MVVADKMSQKVDSTKGEVMHTEKSDQRGMGWWSSEGEKCRNKYCRGAGVKSSHTDR